VRLDHLLSKELHTGSPSLRTGWVQVAASTLRMRVWAVAHGWNIDYGCRRWCWWEYVCDLRVAEGKLLVVGRVDASTLLGPEGTGAVWRK
jgi:hypothetical protein